jgi:lipoate-protein ligase A
VVVDTQILTADGFDDLDSFYGYLVRIFEEVAAGKRPATITVTPSVKHVSVTHRDTRRPGYEGAVREAEALGFPVLVRGSGGGAIAAHEGTFGFSILKPATPGEGRRSIRSRYGEATALALGALARLGVENVSVGEVRDEWCPGDQSLRVGGPENGMKIIGIAQRVRSRATSVGGIVLVNGEGELYRVLTRVYGAMNLPLRPESIGSLASAGHALTREDAMRAFAEEAGERYGAEPAPADDVARR